MKTFIGRGHKDIIMLAIREITLMSRMWHKKSKYPIFSYMTVIMIEIT